MDNKYIIRNIINNLKNNNNNINNILLELVNNFLPEDITNIYYYKLNININYNDILSVWDTFLDNDIFNEYLNILNSQNKIDKNNSSLKLFLCEDELALLLETIFNKHLDSINDNLLLFYIKNENRILIMLKSYLPLLNNMEDDFIGLPYWNCIIDNDIINNKINNLLMNNENLCILSFII